MPKTEVLSNFDALGDMIGAYIGMSDGVKEPKYIESLIHQAHGKVANVFDVAAASAAGPGKLSHMYEFGTAGITAGPVKFADPTSQEARLWIHTLTGRGGNQEIGFDFREALNRNPQPTTASTGVPSKYLRKLSRRKYVFWNKAYVMETGETVNIKPKNNNFLFVPFYGKASNDPQNNRGFMMWDATKNDPSTITNVPGADTKGTFEEFWLSWWSAEGGRLMEEEMTKSVEMDVDLVYRTAQQRANSNPLKPITQTNVNSVAMRARAIAERIFRGRALKR